MKKLIMAIVMVLGLAGITMAQTAPAAAKKQDKKATAAAVKPAVTAQPAATVPATGAPAAVVPAAGPLKKDGTPDKRYKANQKAAAAVHVKKDGTPDKRFKENKKKS